MRYPCRSKQLYEQIASVFAAKRSGKDLSESITKLEAAMKLLREAASMNMAP